MEGRGVMPTYDKLKGRVEALLEHYERLLTAKPGEHVAPSDVASQLRAVLTPEAPADSSPS
jgi:hypothetical protein